MVEAVVEAEAGADKDVGVAVGEVVAAEPGVGVMALAVVLRMLILMTIIL